MNRAQIPPTSPDEWRARYGVHVERRREDLNLSKRAAARRANVSDVTWRQIESGKRQLAPNVTIAPNPEYETIGAVGRALGWTQYWREELDHGHPPTLTPASSPEAPDLDAATRDLPEELTKLPEQMADVLRRLAALEELISSGNLVDTIHQLLQIERMTATNEQFAMADTGEDLPRLPLTTQVPRGGRAEQGEHLEE